MCMWLLVGHLAMQVQLLCIINVVLTIKTPFRTSCGQKSVGSVCVTRDRKVRQTDGQIGMYAHMNALGSAYF